jgi:hypothetical protein
MVMVDNIVCNYQILKYHIDIDKINHQQIIIIIIQIVQGMLAILLIYRIK